MGAKDITEKILESYNDVFADIVNVLLFNGKQVIAPDELIDQAPRAAYKADGKIREIERDVAKRWMKNNIRIACVGLENQTVPDPDMPLRVFGYDGAEYRAQLNNENPGKTRYPVVTLVLYFGTDKHWDQPLTLHEAIEIPAEFKPYVSDIKVNLFEIGYLSRDQVNLFKSDFRAVADYFVQIQETGTYVGSTQELKHIQEVLQLLSVMNKDIRFEEVFNDINEKGELRNMCDVLDRIENRGISKGISRGMAEGAKNKAKATAIRLHARGMSNADIADVLEEDISAVQSWVEPAKA
ncbi:MAG: Rpn family recombination-promoting nuclease/putative transposase [Clostridia bacterium]|nr:Rpn family recombination-promoting nuclease/putative transposase [Clostridia bacterium]MBQ9663902.1 Rpn family recombination-promoting nuclease/putative transposase [Oscillospiraceae bacterium]